MQELNEAREVKLHAEQIAAAAQRELLKERSLSKTNFSLIEVNKNKKTRVFFVYLIRFLFVK
jgi:hypothetical protein